MSYLETPFGSKKSRLIFTRNLLIVVLVSLVTWYICLHIRVTLTPSLTKRVFWSAKDNRKDRPLRSGQYITFKQFVPKPMNMVLTFIKRVGCAPGETLSTGNDYYYCDGKYLGRAKKKSLDGDPLPPFVFNGKIPPGMFFAVGDHPDSFDSRYIGLISRSRIEEVAWALL